MTNVSDLVRYNQPQQVLFSRAVDDKVGATLLTGETFINSYYREKYKSKRKLAKLLKLYRKSGKKAGLID